MKRKNCHGDLPILDCKWVSLFYSQNLFCFVTKNECIYVTDVNNANNIKNLLSNKNIEKYFIRDHFQIFSEKFKCKMRNIYILEIMSEITRTYSNNHSFEAIISEFYNCTIKPFSHNIDKIFNSTSYMHEIQVRLKTIAILEKRWKMILQIMKTYENLQTYNINELISMIK